MKLSMEQKHEHRQQIGGCQGRRGWESIDWEVGINRRMLLYTERINNNDPLYSTETYIQYPVINHNEKEY